MASSPENGWAKIFASTRKLLGITTKEEREQYAKDAKYLAEKNKEREKKAEEDKKKIEDIAKKTENILTGKEGLGSVLPDAPAPKDDGVLWFIISGILFLFIVIGR